LLNECGDVRDLFAFQRLSSNILFKNVFEAWILLVLFLKKALQLLSMPLLDDFL
jgi:hypothetical protein